MDTTTQPTTDTEAMYRKVQALLAKAERTDHPAEAEAFSAKAFELIERHRLDMARLRKAQDADEFGAVYFTMVGYKFLRASRALLTVVAKHFGCTALGTATGNSKRLLMAGNASDIEATVLMFTSLIVQRDRACLAWNIPRGMNTTKARTSFAYGYANRIAERLEAIRDAAKAANTDSMAVELYDRYNTTLRKLEESAGIKTAASNLNRPTVYTAGIDEGEAAADRADLGQDRIDGNGPRALGR